MKILALSMKTIWVASGRLSGTFSSLVESISRKPIFTKNQWWLATLLFSLFFLMANYHLLMGLYSPIWDADSYYAPYYILLADFSRARKLLLWDPWSSGGTPAFINPQVGALSPLTIASGLLTGGSESGFRFYWLFIWWLGGLGIIALSRHLQSPPWGGVIAALGFTFSGFYTGHAEHTSLLYAMSFLPFIIWRMDGALVARRLFLSLEA